MENYAIFNKKLIEKDKNMVDFRNKNIKIDPKYLERDPNKQYVACVSYGKDSLAMLEVIKNYGLPLDRIITVEVWATDTIHADLPPMIEFKSKADKIIKDRYGIEVEHLCALDKQGNKLTYDNVFHRVTQYNKPNKHSFLRQGQIYGFPVQTRAWCNSQLKVAALKRIDKNKNTVRYLGIALDEPERVERHINKENIVLPLVIAHLEEKECKQWCEENELLSPIYNDMARGGCWFCHNQTINQLRLLRKNYPEYWDLLMQWDLESHIKFTPDHSVHDFDKRFEAEDLGLVPMNRKFRWKMLDKTDGD